MLQHHSVYTVHRHCSRHVVKHGSSAGIVSVMPGCCIWSCRLYKVHEEDGKPFELEMSWICEESGWKHARVRMHVDTCIIQPPSDMFSKPRICQRCSCEMAWLDGHVVPCPVGHGLLWDPALCCAMSHSTLACVLYVCRCQQRCRQTPKHRRRQHRKSLTWRTRALCQLSCSRDYARGHVVTAGFRVESMQRDGGRHVECVFTSHCRRRSIMS